MSKYIFYFTGALVSIFAFSIYGVTMAPGITFVDSGELAAVCSTLGIAHPTGYPLYTILGRLFTMLPFQARPIVLLNLMSAVFSGISLFIFFMVVRNIFFKNADPSGPLQTQFSGPLAAAACGTGTLFLAFSQVFWNVSLITEVYALHSLFVSLFIFWSLKAFYLTHCPEKKSFLCSCMVFLCIGLSFCNHMSTVLLLPALIYSMVVQRKIRYFGLRKIFFLSMILISGLCVYIYLPIKASQEPLLNWGDPQTWETFFWHVSGKQYRVWMFSGFDVAVTQGEYFIRLVLDSYGYVPVLLIPFGVWHLFHRNRQVFWFLFIIFVSDIVYSINYDIHDIDAYFLPAFIVCSLWMSSAVIFFLTVLNNHKNALYKVWIGALCALPLIPLLFHFDDLDQSNNTLVEQYTNNIVRSVEKNAIILSYQWDYFCSPFYYLQLAEGIRPDIVMIEVKLVRRSWYITQLQNNYPGIMAKSSQEVDLYMQELQKFEHGEPYDPAVIQRYYMNLVNSFIQQNIQSRPVYITCELEKEIGRGFQRIPEGLVFRIRPLSRQYSEFDDSFLDLPAEEDFNPDDRYRKALKSFYAFMLSARGAYEARFGNHQKAESMFRKATDVSSGYPLAKQGMQALRKKSR